MEKSENNRLNHKIKIKTKDKNKTNTNSKKIKEKTQENILQQKNIISNGEISIVHNQKHNLPLQDSNTN